MGQCMSSGQQFALYCRIPRDLAGNIYSVQQGYSDLLYMDDLRISQRGIRITRRLLEQSSFETLSISFCVFKNAAVKEDFANLVRSKECIKRLLFTQNTTALAAREEEGQEVSLSFLVKSFRGRKMDEIELNDRTIYGAKGEAFLVDLLTTVFPQNFQLKYMSLDVPSIRGLCTGLRSPLCTIKSLSLRECWVDDEMLSLLVDALCENSSSSSSSSSTKTKVATTELNLESNSFSPAALESLARLIYKNTGLENLILDRNENLFFGATEKDAADFANAVQSNTTLLTLSLSMTDLGNTVAIPLFRALETNTTLQCLHFDDTFIGIEGYRQFIQSLAHLHLHVLSVGWDEIFEEFPVELKNQALEALRGNECLIYWRETSMSYDDRYSSLLTFFLTRNQHMVQARKVLQSATDKNDWQKTVTDLASEESGASAIFEILRQRLPAHTPVAQIINDTAAKKLLTSSTTSDAASLTESSSEDDMMSTFMDSTDVVS